MTHKSSKPSMTASPKNKKSICPIKKSKLRWLRTLVRDERGMSTVEYVILLVVIVAGAVSVWNEIGEKIMGGLKESNAAIQDLHSTSAEE